MIEIRVIQQKSGFVRMVSISPDDKEEDIPHVRSIAQEGEKLLWSGPFVSVKKALEEAKAVEPRLNTRSWMVEDVEPRKKRKKT
jgi:protein tyrosine phosphatase (PTP) superfamily phosphohydrolase (DUF442 family)